MSVLITFPIIEFQTAQQKERKRLEDAQMNIAIHESIDERRRHLAQQAKAAEEAKAQSVSIPSRT